MLGSAVHDWVGLAGVAWLRAAGIILLFCALVHLARLVAGLRIAILCAALGLASAWPALTTRPQRLGFVLLVPVIDAWWRTGTVLRPRWWLVPDTCLAASCHGLLSS